MHGGNKKFCWFLCEFFGGTSILFKLIKIQKTLSINIILFVAEKFKVSYKLVIHQRCSPLRQYLFENKNEESSRIVLKKQQINLSRPFHIVPAKYHETVI
jgi:hypothetical protein